MTRLRPLPLTALALLPAATAPAHAADGAFRAGQELPVTRPAALAAGDFDNDGRRDLAVVSEANNRAYIFVQSPPGALTPAGNVPVGTQPGLIAVSDFDRDGNDDLAVVNSYDRSVSIRLGTGDAKFTSAPGLDLGRAPTSLVTGDFNGDGIDDLAAAGLVTGVGERVTLRIGAGDGTFSAGTDVGPGAATLLPGDFNGDAIADLLYTGVAPGAVARLLRGTGGGAFAPPTTVPLPERATARHALAVADFDADSNLDLAAALDPGDASVLLGAGDGSFARARELELGGMARAVAVGDLDADGNEDLVVADAAGAGTVRVRLGDVNGNFRAVPDVPAGAPAYDVAIADFDSDGVDDLALANTLADKVSIRLGTGPEPLAGNLLVNGGFEGPSPSGRPQPAPFVAGWQLSGMAPLRYGAISHSLVPSWVDAPRWSGGGRLLSGGDSRDTGGVTTATQTVDVSASAAAIDAGRVTASFAAELGGALHYEDAMTATAEFRTAAGELAGTLQLGPVTAADRRNHTTLLRRSGRRIVPPGTRAIRVVLRSDDADKTFSSALADNAELTLATAPPRDDAPLPPPPPPPPPPVEAFGPDTLVELVPARRRPGAGRPLRVRVRNSNGFAVTGTLAVVARRPIRAALARRDLRVGPGATTIVEVALPARLCRKRVLRLRLAAVVRDPDGNSRRVVERARVLPRR